MKKKIKTTLFFVLFFVICGCGEADKKENNMNEPTQKQKAENYSPATQKTTRNAYFLDKKTIFSAEVPENWYDEIVFLNNSSQAKIQFRCVASEMEGFYETNFFDITVGEKTKNREYEEYGETEFQYINGQKGKRYTWEYTDELMEEIRYHADVLVLPGDNFLVRSSEYQDPYLTVGRYEKNKSQIEAFYNSILYQEQAEQIGREPGGELQARERIRVHLRNDFLNVEFTVPEGIFYDSETNPWEFGGGATEEFCLRLYLDDGKKNYVDICSDLCGMIAERIIITKGYRAEILDSGELAYYSEWGSPEPGWGDLDSEEFRQCWYTFGYMYPVGAKICVEKERADLYKLAQEIVHSFRFE
ncbi:MAG: hypothetical protein K2O03_14660 [Lachnospiraceae bacterium]|nr:hypothetical protein [Lachnospiraceae bacterium]